MLKQTEEKIKDFRLTFTRQETLNCLDRLQSNPCNIDNLVKELQKCDFSLYGEFLGKIKIFQCQSNENSFETLIKKTTVTLSNVKFMCEFHLQKI